MDLHNQAKRGDSFFVALRLHSKAARVGGVMPQGESVA